MTYQEWIERYSPHISGRCKETTKRMAEEFPELRRVRGHYYCWVWGKRAHWWLMDGDEVIDPTAAQFPSKGEGRYEEWDESQMEPTGKCPNCGEYCYNGDLVCSERCHTEFLTHLGIS